jgi:hypothetical protein
MNVLTKMLKGYHYDKQFIVGDFCEDAHGRDGRGYGHASQSKETL